MLKGWFSANKKGPTEKKDFGKMNMLEAPRQVSQQVIDRIRQKLTGKWFFPLSLKKLNKFSIINILIANDFWNYRNCAINYAQIKFCIEFVFYFVICFPGREFEPGVEVDVREQLNRLVEQATLPLNLCQCYIGWCPFW